MLENVKLFLAQDADKLFYIGIGWILSVISSAVVIVLNFLKDSANKKLDVKKDLMVSYHMARLEAYRHILHHIEVLERTELAEERKMVLSQMRTHIEQNHLHIDEGLIRNIKCLSVSNCHEADFRKGCAQVKKEILAYREKTHTMRSFFKL